MILSVDLEFHFNKSMSPLFIWSFKGGLLVKFILLMSHLVPLKSYINIYPLGSDWQKSNPTTVTRC